LAIDIAAGIVTFFVIAFLKCIAKGFVTAFFVAAVVEGRVARVDSSL
jgi:Fe2+ transport system protein B